MGMQSVSMRGMIAGKQDPADKLTQFHYTIIRLDKHSPEK